MTIDLSEQHRLALVQEAFRARVTAAMFSAAVTMMSATPNADTKIQDKRLKLVMAIVVNTHTYLDAFAWAVVSRPQPLSENDLNDTFILNTVSAPAIFDGIAQQVIP